MRYGRNILRDERSALVQQKNHGEIRGVNHSQLTLQFKTGIRNQPVATWVARSKTRHRSCCTCTYSANDRLTHSQITAWQICTHLSIPVPRSALPIGTGYSRKVQASVEGARSAVRRTRGRSRSTVMLPQHCPQRCRSAAATSTHCCGNFKSLESTLHLLHVN